MEVNDYLIQRLDKMENKIDILLEFKNKALGIIIALTVLCQFISFLISNSVIIKKEDIYGVQKEKQR